MVSIPTLSTAPEAIKSFISWCRSITSGKFLKRHYADMLIILGRVAEAAKVLSGKMDVYFIPVTMRQLCDEAEEKFLFCRLPNEYKEA